MHINEIYIIDTLKGKCRCRVANGVYYPMREEDENFIGEPIMDIELIDNNEKVWYDWQQMEFEWKEKE
jgi:hypothetical protein